MTKDQTDRSGVFAEKCLRPGGSLSHAKERNQANGCEDVDDDHHVRVVGHDLDL